MTNPAPTPNPTSPKGKVNAPSGASEGSVLNPGAWMNFFTEVPCVKEGLVTGLVMGGVMLVHMRRTQPKATARALNFAFGSFVFGSSASFFLCAEEYNRRVKDNYEARRAGAIPMKRPRPPAGPPAGPTGSV